MHLLDRVNFDRKKPLTPKDFMNFTGETDESHIDPDLDTDRIDREVFGI